MQHLIVYILLVLLAVPQMPDSLYTEKAAMDAYATQPERAIQIIDSAKIVGNMTALRADILRTVVYARTYDDRKLDSAILIGERLMHHDSVKANPALQEDVLGVLLYACRIKRDNEQALRWATQLSNLYRSFGEETEALRNDAEIGTLLIRIGQQEEGLARIDTAIRQLGVEVDGFNKLDASIIALKRKAEICNEIGLYDEMILAAQRMLDLLDNYEQHPSDYHDGSFREPSEEDRLGYIDFYRGKAYAYLTLAYASLGENEKANEYIVFYEQTSAIQSVTGRFVIAPALGMLGQYEQMLAIFDEVEQQMGDDTLNANYAEILRGRAEAAEAQGRYADACTYWRRHDELNNELNDRLLQSKAHLYAARFHTQEQQREIERHREATRRANLSLATIGIVGLLVLLFALYAVAQWHKTKQRNRILAQQITKAAEYKEKWKTESEKRKTEGKQLSTSNAPLSTLPDAELYNYLRDLIENEQMFLNPNFERQLLINRTGLSKERIGAAFAQGSDHERLTTLIRELRLDYAVRLINDKPELTVEQVCQASGFTNADTFTRNFKAKYGMTPTAYRESKA